ncbi:YveK family protein [Paenibacillus glycanilyticus]|uniref:YveK family protein n=1 Tax=Paenibacillus glycanilyticus TaxID=126569 RepID=UPI003EBF5B70
MTLTYKNYWDLFRRTKWFLTLFPIACLLAAVFVSMYVVKPVYVAESSLLIYKANQTPGREQIDLDAVQTNTALAPTYAALITDPFILDKVVARLPDMGLKTEKLQKQILVSAGERSQIITISYKAYSFDNAKQIINTVATVFKDEIQSVVGIDNIQILYTANIPNSDSVIRPNVVTNAIIAVILGVIISSVAVLIREAVRDTYHSEEAIAVELNVAVLGTIRQIKRKEFRKKQPVEEKIKRRVSEVPKVEAF